MDEESCRKLAEKELLCCFVVKAGQGLMDSFIRFSERALVSNTILMQSRICFSVC